jgi:hypothetical protein
MPMADDDDGVMFERLFLDKENPNILHNEMTAIDNSLARPWTVMKNYRRAPKVWVGGEQLHRRANLGHHRQSSVLPQRRRHYHADKETSAATGFEIFRADQEVSAEQRLVQGRPQPV